MMTFDNDGQALKKLHARIADIHDGYRGSIDRTTDGAAAAFFEGFREMHDRHMAALDRLMLARELEPMADGTWARLSHAGMMAFRQIVHHLDGRVIDTAIRSERTLLDLYDEALEAVRSDGDARAVLLNQKSDILHRIMVDDLAAMAA